MSDINPEKVLQILLTQQMKDAAQVPGPEGLDSLHSTLQRIMSNTDVSEHILGHKVETESVRALETDWTQQRVYIKVDDDVFAVHFEYHIHQNKMNIRICRIRSFLHINCIALPRDSEPENADNAEKLRKAFEDEFIRLMTEAHGTVHPFIGSVEEDEVIQKLAQAGITAIYVSLAYSKQNAYIGHIEIKGFGVYTVKCSKNVCLVWKKDELTLRSRIATEEVELDKELIATLLE